MAHTAKIEPVERKGLPSNTDAERFILGQILLDDTLFVSVASVLESSDFTLDKHRTIFSRMCQMQMDGEKIDRVTLANILMRYSELESVDGLSYIVSLDDGLPKLPNIDSYIRIVKDKSILRQIVFSGQNLVSRAINAEEDPQVLLQAAGENFLKLAAEDNRKGPRSIGQIVDDFEGGINALFDPSKRVQGLSTGFSKFDEMTTGLHKGELIILAARPSMGKTAMALNIASHVGLKKKEPVVIFSLEMSAESLLTRLLCATAYVDSQRYRAGYLNADERKKLAVAAAQLVDARVFIDDSAGSTAMDMHSKLRKLIAEQGGVGLVIVDYLQLMTQHGRTENRNQEVSAISRNLKLMAKDLNVPMLVLSQLSRGPETRAGDHRPQLSDLRESGSIEQDADLVGFIFREEVYKRDRDDLRGMAELIIAKQRNGPIGKIDLVYLHSLTKFENRAEDLGDPAGEGGLFQ